MSDQHLIDGPTIPVLPPSDALLEWMRNQPDRAFWRQTLRCWTCGVAVFLTEHNNGRIVHVDIDKALFWTPGHPGPSHCHDYVELTSSYQRAIETFDDLMRTANPVIMRDWLQRWAHQ